MKLKKIVSIIGARPQFIKHAAMHLQLVKRFETITIHTGQHYDDNMSRVFFDELNIDKPNYIFNLGNSIKQGEQTAIMMIEIEKVLEKELPEAVLIYGDTNSTLAGALVAAKMNIPIIHIEAGLRSFNRAMPEEINRIVADTFSSVLFCPTNIAVKNLKNEGIDAGKIFLTGDVMADMVKIFVNNLTPINSSRYYFATIHRPYNTDNQQRFIELLLALNSLKHEVVFSMHPRTKHKAEIWGINLNDYSNIVITGPVSYKESLSYQKYSECVITDSGGMQKEAYLMKKKCITLRSETEWLETLDGGWNTLVFEDLSEIKSILDIEPQEYNERLYGDGSAAQEIVLKISELFN